MSAATNSRNFLFMILGSGCILITFFYTIPKFGVVIFPVQRPTIPPPKPVTINSVKQKTEFAQEKSADKTEKPATEAKILAPTSIVTKLFLNLSGKYFNNGEQPLTTAKLINSTPKRNNIIDTYHNNTNVSEQHKNSTINILTMNFQGRLGNLLFEYASLYGIAKHLHVRHAIGIGNHLRKIFQISAVSSTNLLNSKTYNEKRGCVFEKDVFNLDLKYNWTLKGYFQSWKYFKEIEDEIRKEYKFNNNIQVEAAKQFQEIIRTHNITDPSKITFVAVHIRRGDMVSSRELIEYGYSSADKNYIHSAMKSFQSNYSDLLFVVSSDDISWCRGNIQMPNTAFITSKNTPEVDMAIMSRCNHSIITTGSFGWWTAWLINGTNIFYKKFPRAGSKLSKLFEFYDYWIPAWIPM